MKLIFLKNYLRNSFSLHDQENTFFKYPEHSVKIVVNYSQVVENITRDDVKLIKKDIDSVKKIAKKFKTILKD